MAVQKTKKSKSRTGMKRSHHALKAPTLTVEIDSGETHRRHHISASGMYRGRQVLPLPPEPTTEDNPREG